MMLINFAKRHVLNVWQASKYASIISNIIVINCLIIYLSLLRRPVKCPSQACPSNHLSLSLKHIDLLNINHPEFRCFSFSPVYCCRDIQKVVFIKFIKFFGAGMQLLVFDTVQIFFSCRIAPTTSSQFLVVKSDSKWRISKAFSS